MNTPKDEETIFAAALALPPEERAACLDQACGGDSALRHRVEVLLNSHAADAFLEEPAAPVASHTLRIFPPVSERPGDRIGRYKLLQQIGEGGCGVVYMAEQDEPVQRRVALKVIKLGMDTKQVIARFEAERQALALMDHPNIAKVLDGGATETGRPYFVMELVRGIKITEFCDHNNLPTRERLELFMQVCRAIQHAHQKGIIHRDIKPSNILVTINDGVPVPKVIDFGIAKATQGRLTDKTLFTAFEQFIGTPAYMSPEQAAMTSLDIDTRSDIYSLGVLLYELLTGKTPFDSKELLEAGLDAMRRTILEKEPERPSTKLSTMVEGELTITAKRHHTEPPKLLSSVRGDLDWIVMKCLEKDRARRYETANGLASDLQRHLDQEPVTACPPSNVYRFQKLVRRNKLAFAAAAAVAASLLMGLGISTWMFFQERAAKQEQARLRLQAEAQEQKAQTEAQKSDQVAEFLKEMLKGVGPSVALGRDTKMLQEILEKTVQRFDKYFTNQPEVRAELEGIIALTYWDLGEPAKSEKMYREALDIWRKLFGNEHPKVAGSLYGLGTVLEGREDAEAEKVYREALAIRRKLLGDESPEVGDSVHRLGAMLDNQGRREEAEVLFREALTIRKKVFGNEHPKVVDSQGCLATTLYVEGKKSPAEYEAEAREILAAYKRLLGNENFSVVGSFDGLAGFLQGQGRLAEAELLWRESLAMRRKLEGDEHPGTAFSLKNLAGVLTVEGRLAEAEPLYREALAKNKKRLGDDHPRVTEVLSDLAMMLANQGRLSEAEALLREAVASNQAINKKSGNAVQLPSSLNNLAVVLRVQGKLTEAESTYREMLEMSKKLVSGRAEQGVASSQNELAWMLATSVDATVRDGRSAVEFAEKAVAATQRKNTAILDTLAAAYAEAGQFERAATVQQEAIDLLPDQNQKEDFASRLKLYETNTAYREPGLGGACANLLAAITSNLLKEGRFVEAEQQARRCLAIREKVFPTDWRTFNSRSQLGGSLLGLQKYTEAEALLISAYEGMKKHEGMIPNAGKTRLKETIRRLVRLYEATSRNDEAARWRTVANDWYRKQVEQYRKAADLENVEGLNGLARLLATCEDSAIRDGRNAVTFAEKAVAAANRRDPMTLDTLAAAYAESGEFDKAVVVQREAMVLLDSNVLKTDFATRLKLYESNTPYRER